MEGKVLQSIFRTEILQSVGDHNEDSKSENEIQIRKGFFTEPNLVFPNNLRENLYFNSSMLHSFFLDIENRDEIFDTAYK